MDKKNGNKIYELPGYAMFMPDVKRVIANKEKRVVVVELMTGEKGKAVCCPNDTYREELGFAVAYNKARIKFLKHEISDCEYIIKHI